MPDLSQRSIGKVLRWAFRLSMFHSTCMRIKGDENVWRDVLTRWYVPPPCIRRIVYIHVLVALDAKNFKYLSLDEMIPQKEILEGLKPTSTDPSDLLWKN